MEEWAARALDAADYFFAWRVAPTVICGRNQDIAAEVDLDYCRREGIAVVRRRSGGGAVYADMNNWMFSYITPSEEVQTTFARYTTMVAGMLRGLGVAAQANGRNDIVVEGRKISGNAFYHLPGRSIAHGTMLHSIDSERLAHALTPSRAKLAGKGVRSVPMRVTSLTEQGLAMSVEDFGEYAVGQLTESTYTLTAADISAIEEIEQKYYRPEWLKTQAPSVSPDIHTTTERFEGVGEISARYRLDDRGAIAAFELSGDFFVLGDVGHLICRPLTGLSASDRSAGRLPEGVDASRAIAGMKNEHLISLIQKLRMQ